MCYVNFWLITYYIDLFFLIEQLKQLQQLKNFNVLE